MRNWTTCLKPGEHIYGTLVIGLRFDVFLYNLHSRIHWIFLAGDTMRRRGTGSTLIHIGLGSYSPPSNNPDQCNPQKNFELEFCQNLKCLQSCSWRFCTDIVILIEGQMNLFNEAQWPTHTYVNELAIFGSINGLLGAKPRPGPFYTYMIEF